MHATRSEYKIASFTVVLSLLVLAVSIQGSQADQSTAFSPLEPTALMARTSKMVVDQVRSHHIDPVRLDDNASSLVFDRYLDRIDRNRQYLLESDVKEFENYRYEFDNALKIGNLAPAFEIFNRQLMRRRDQLNWTLNRLAQGIDTLDLTTDEQIVLDREMSSFPASQEEAEKLWEQRLVNEVISQKLNGKELDEIQDTLKKRFEVGLNRLNKTKPRDVFDVYINAFTYVYDPHTNYFSPRSTEDFNVSFNLSLEGIGAVLTMDEDYVEILSLVPGGPAELDGTLKAKDRIVAISQSTEGPFIDVVGWRLDEVVELIRGPKDTLVVLEVLTKEGDIEETRRIPIVRDKVNLNEERAKKQILTINHNGEDHRLGIIEVKKFYVDMAGESRRSPNYRSVTRDVREILRQLEEEDVDGVILDLRRNGGGSLNEAHKLTGLFIESGPTVQVRGKGSNPQVFRDGDGKMAWSGPLAVVVNRQSASASEIVSGAIQDYQRGLILGNQTYGKGTVQTLVPLNHGQLKVTQAKYYRITGESTQHEGVHPDIEFPSLIDANDIGESTIDGAMPHSTIAPVSFTRYTDRDQMIDDLKAAHEGRIETDPYFVYYHELAKRIEANRAITHVSLNEEKQREIRDEYNDWRLKVENNLLTAIGEQPAENLDELDDRLEEIKKKFEDQPDAILKESARILLDYINSGAAVAQVTPS